MKVTTGTDQTARVTLSRKEIAERLFPFLPEMLQNSIDSHEESFVFVVHKVDDLVLSMLNENFPSESPAPLSTGIDALLDTKLVNLSGHLSTRAINALTTGKYQRIETLRELVGFKRSHIQCFQNLGKKTYIELDEFLVSKGLKWSE